MKKKFIQKLPFIKDELMKGSFDLFIGGMVANICNYLFQFIMSRGLSVAEFGAMNSLLSLMVLASVPATSVLLICAKHVSELKAAEKQGKIRLFQIKTISSLSFFGLLFLVFSFLIAPLTAAFLNINSILPIILLFFILFLTFIIPVNIGTLQGMQNFFDMCILWITGAVTKIVFGLSVIMLGFKLNGAVGSILAGCLATFLFSFYFLRKLPARNSKTEHDGFDYKKMWMSSMPIVVCSLCISGLSNIDLLLVKHFFSADEAGIYASVSVLGRTIYYMPSAIIMAMFPIVSESHALKSDPFHLLKKALCATIILAGFVLMVLSLFPELMLTLLFGSNYSEGASLLRFFSASMFFLTIIFVLSTFLLAIERKGFLVILLIGNILEISLISFFHQTLNSVLMIVLSITLLMLICLICTIVFLRKKNLQLDLAP